MSSSFDALVIGAGAGGMAAAGRLQALGYRTLLVERFDRVGGRASTREVDGFRINTGALVTETGGENGRLFADLGLDPGLRMPKRPVVLRLGKRDVPLMSGPTGFVAQRLLSAVGAFSRRTGKRPAPGPTLADWLDKRKAKPALRSLARNLTSALYAAEPEDVELVLFWDYLTKPGGMSPYAVHPEGAIGPWRAVAADFVQRGGTLWLNREVVALRAGADGRIDGATIRHGAGEGAETVDVTVRAVVSNAGPLQTAELCPPQALPAGYLDRLRAWSKTGALITINFASRTPLGPINGLYFFSTTRRLAYAAELTGPCPEMAPPGWRLYLGACSPSPATGEFDLDAELALLRADLREHFPGYDTAREISVAVCSGQDWPAQRAVPGKDEPQSTPVPNLWNVGDGARAWAGAGQSGCVESARLAVEELARTVPVAQKVSVDG
jgi:phytoene dehydrogenase-like protein